MSAIRKVTSYWCSVAMRPLLMEDIDDAFELSSLAGWNQTRDDWRLLLESAEVCLAVEADGRLASTATLICYGTKLAWVGMILTHPDFRRRGFARTLMNEVMKRAFELRIATVKLDATDFGRPCTKVLDSAPNRRLSDGSGAA